MQLKSTYEGYLFDVDGTLVDSIPMIVAGLTATYHELAGISLSEPEVRALIGIPLRVQMSQFGLELSPMSLEERIEATLTNYQKFSHLQTGFGDALAAVQDACSAGIPVALVTSRNTLEVEHLLKDFPALARVSTIVCASDTVRPKPSPDPALLACERLSLSPHECLFIGDSRHDLDCARAAGCDFLAVAYGAASADALRPDSTELVNTPAELRQTLTTLTENSRCQLTRKI